MRGQNAAMFAPHVMPDSECRSIAKSCFRYWTLNNAAMFAPHVMPDSECRSIAKSCFRYWTLNYDTKRFSEIQTARNGKRWHGDYTFDFDHQAQDVHQYKAWGLKQVTIAAVVDLSPSRVSRILSQGL